MTTLLEDLRTRLVDAGLGPVALGRRPSAPAEVIVIQSYPAGPSRVFDDDNQPAVEELSAQVVVRAAGPGGAQQRSAEVLARQVHAAITGRHLVLNGNHYDDIRANHLPAPIGVDEDSRALVVINLTIRRRGFQATVAA